MLELLLILYSCVCSAKKGDFSAEKCSAELEMYHVVQIFVFI